MVKESIAFIGLLAALGLTGLSGVTSVQGIQGIIGSTESTILIVCPYCIAGLVLAFNACSSYILKSAVDEGLPLLSKLYLVAVWCGALTFDAVSSFTGLAGAMYGQPISSVAEFMQALRDLGGAQSILAISVSILATTGPFLSVVFAQITGRGGGIFASISKLFD